MQSFNFNTTPNYTDRNSALMRHAALNGMLKSQLAAQINVILSSMKTLVVGNCIKDTPSLHLFQNNFNNLFNLLHRYVGQLDSTAKVKVESFLSKVANTPIYRHSVSELISEIESIVSELSGHSAIMNVSSIEELKTALLGGFDIKVTPEFARDVISTFSKVSEYARNEAIKTELNAPDSEINFYEFKMEDGSVQKVRILTGGDIVKLKDGNYKEALSPLGTWSIKVTNGNHYTIYKIAKDKYAVVYGDSIGLVLVDKNTVKEALFIDRNGASIRTDLMRTVIGLDCDRIVCRESSKGLEALYSVSEGAYKEFFEN